MSGIPRKVALSGAITVLLILVTAMILQHALIDNKHWYGCLLITLPAMPLVALFTGYRQIIIE